MHAELLQWCLWMVPILAFIFGVAVINSPTAETHKGVYIAAMVAGIICLASLLLVWSMFASGQTQALWYGIGGLFLLAAGLVKYATRSEYPHLA